MKTVGWIFLGKLKDGSYIGYIENSFSMGVSFERVRLERYWEWTWKGRPRTVQQVHNLLKERVIKLNKKKLANAEWSLYRIGRKTCPVKIDWRELVNFRKYPHKRKKFEWRNLPFSKK